MRRTVFATSLWYDSGDLHYTLLYTWIPRGYHLGTNDSFAYQSPDIIMSDRYI